MAGEQQVRTAAATEDARAEDASAALDEVVRRALAAQVALDRLGRAGRVQLLRGMADALEARRAELVAAAGAETRLSEKRLDGELTRTCYQFRFFGEVVTEGSFLDATIDTAGPTLMGPRPDLRRTSIPRGPVAVFGASNFPFAFSVPGGDTASAVAAGCSVVVKVHEGHPETSALCGEALREAGRAAGIEDVVQLVTGQETGLALVRHPGIAAGGFTGSVPAGRLLHDAASTRPSPIPFHGELGALNVLVVAPDAAAARGPELADGLAASAVLGTGQFCTKPGLALLPAGPAGDAVRQRLAEAFTGASAGPMLTDRIAERFATGAEALTRAPRTRVLAQGAAASGDGAWGTPLLLEAEADALEGVLLEECFGPVLVVATYESAEHLRTLLPRAGGALTGTVHADSPDDEVAASALQHFTVETGRVIWNGFPTGVAVSWAMHHSGPYPSTTDVGATSVGAAAIRRWLRPVCYQDVPQELLPPELRDGSVDVPRRVDGLLVLPDGYGTQANELG